MNNEVNNKYNLKTPISILIIVLIIISVITIAQITIDDTAIITTQNETTVSPTNITIPTTTIFSTQSLTTQTTTKTENTTELTTEQKEENINEININNEDTNAIVDNEPNESDIDNQTTENENNNNDFLLDINNPDNDYAPSKYNLSSEEREEIACIVMGEFGNGGFIGCALLAQCIRDAMSTYGYSGLTVKNGMQYYGYNPNPNSTCYEAIDWIFDGNSAVQHRILVMNNSADGWHSTQNYIIDYQGVWFYDLWQGSEMNYE